ncbi:MAG: N-6 DNA methylase [Micropruina glycogenica]
MTSGLASDSAELRKARGAYFTPPDVSGYLARWSIRSGHDRVLEPSCGDGSIISAAVNRLHALGGYHTPVQAHELHEQTAADARQLLAALDHPGEVAVGDFLATKAGQSFDAVIGNPPYIRFQGFTGDARASGLAAALAQGVRLSKLSSSWAPFVVHAAGHLRTDGRLGLVLPAELLSSNYAQDVRDFLLRRFASVSVVLINEQVFPDAQTEALLLLAEGTGGTHHIKVAVAAQTDELHDVRFDTQLSVRLGDRWTTALVPDAAVSELSSALGSGIVSPLSNWGRLTLGGVTGNNNFFTMSPTRADELGLHPSDLVGISPAGSRHLRALTFDARAHAAAGTQGLRTLLFRPDRPSPGASAYIANGEEQGVHRAYKCSVRTPWWRTPLPAPPHLFFTYMNHATPQLATNPARLHYLNSVHGLYLHTDTESLGPELALAALNSLTALSAEISGRAYGGGVLKLEPGEAARLLVPSPEIVRANSAELRAAAGPVRRLLAEGRIAEARTIVDNVILSRPLNGAALAEVREAHELMAKRRSSRAKGRDTGRSQR